MPDRDALLLFLATGLALNLTPGPDMLYVAARSASEGRGAGVASALGIAAGTLVHIALVAFGLAALLAAVPVAYTIVRLAGAAYLVYLGVRALWRPSALAERALAPASRWAVFRQGVVTNVLNPKVALFFLAFLPQFVDPARGSAALQVLALGLLFDTSGTIVNLAVALGASGAAGRLRRSARAAQLLERATGALFVALGVRLALAGRR
ncbi:LysE family translocator [Roseisolibacter agri]|uniref:LysE type translocator n=1 Tax=Roseisolibacter agri TaxID=2014610 RepID=A0AA37Q0D6_9BACT|nr:LysE family translocator [Roseisolibacter agri]GLC24199.1 LysE type translocator [Roseisolibacter agri]